LLSCFVTTASAERFFSSLRRLKNYLRNTIGDERVSNIALYLMAIEKENVVEIMTKNGLSKLINIFIHGKSRRLMLIIIFFFSV